MAERKIRKIEKTTSKSLQISHKANTRKVAAYARVSTSSIEQENSLEAQLDYFQKLIRLHSDWQFVEVYHDDGISGLSRKKREGFNRMLEDARIGKMDLILTKSLSRFARNTVDSLVAIRTLKSLGVEVYFEKEDIFTFDAKGEFLITLMSSLAQEESRSLSENVTWGMRKRFSDGKYAMPYSRFIGYKKGADGKPVIDYEQEPIIRLVFRLYLLGESERAICYFLEYHKYSLIAANTPKWHDSRIRDILLNEKYKGDALLQKQYTVDYLTKKIKNNEGELPQYYVHGGHDAIIPPKLFDAISLEQERRKRLKRRFSCTSAMSSKIKCSVCDNYYGIKADHSNSKYRSISWRCTHYYDGGMHSPKIKDIVLRGAISEIIESIINRYNHIPQICADFLSELIMTDIPASAIVSYVKNNEKLLRDYWLLRTLIDHAVIYPDRHLEFHTVDGEIYIHT